MIDNLPYQPSKFRTKNWVEINDDSRQTYNTYSQIRFKTMILNLSICSCNDVYILFKVTITVPNTTATDVAANNANKKVIVKNWAKFTDSRSKTNNSQVDNAKIIDVVMQMYNSVIYRDNCSKTSAILWQYYRDEPDLNAADAVIDFPGDNSSASFRFKQEVTG